MILKNTKMNIDVKVIILITILFTAFLFDLSAQSFLPVYKKGQGTFEEVQVFGKNSDEENYVLAGPTKFIADAEGNLFVLDSKDNNIKKYDKNGKFVTTFSRSGQGPGEIQRCYQMSIDPEGNIVTNDLGNRRFSFFNNDGKFLHSIPFKKIIWNFKIGPKGKFYIETRDFDYRGDKGGTLIKIIQFSPDFRRTVPVDSMRIKDNIHINEPVSIFVPQPYPANLSWDISPGGNIIVAYSGDYTIKVFSPEVKLIKKFQFKGERIKISKEEKEEFFAGIVTTSSGGGIKRGAPDYIRKNTKFPKYKPYFMSIIIDHEGYILARTYGLNEKYNIIDVFTQDGEFINSVKLFPVNFTSTYNQGFVYSLKTTEDYLYYIVKYALK